jgi:hypothetical protein
MQSDAGRQLGIDAPCDRNARQASVTRDENTASRFTNIRHFRLIRNGLIRLLLPAGSSSSATPSCFCSPASISIWIPAALLRAASRALRSPPPGARGDRNRGRVFVRCRRRPTRRTSPDAVVRNVVGRRSCSWRSDGPVASQRGDPDVAQALARCAPAGGRKGWSDQRRGRCTPVPRTQQCGYAWPVLAVAAAGHPRRRSAGTHAGVCGKPTMAPRPGRS